ncbi:MAG: hypothetical protein ACFFB9_15545, partial [Promethearchaeota archaeon]
MKKNKNLIGFLILTCIFFSGIFQILALNLSNPFKEQVNPEQINASGQETYASQWLENPAFSSLDNWTFSKGILGDPDDLDASID